MANVAIGLSQNLPNGRVMRAIVHEQDLVVWRSKSGNLSAWDNRCPHRGMRLSHGFVRGEALACVYHGWHYDKKATCRYIPAHPELEPPETIKAQAYSSTEKGGIIWVNIDGHATEPSIDDNLSPLRSISFNCPIDVVQNVIGNSDLPNFGTELDNIDIDIDKPSSDRWVLHFNETKAILHLFFQMLPNQSCSIHALLSGEHQARLKKNMSHFLEFTRRAAEQQFKATAI